MWRQLAGRALGRRPLPGLGCREFHQVVLAHGAKVLLRAAVRCPRLIIGGWICWRRRVGYARKLHRLKSVTSIQYFRHGKAMLIIRSATMACMIPVRDSSRVFFACDLHVWFFAHDLLTDRVITREWLHVRDSSRVISVRILRVWPQRKCARCTHITRTTQVAAEQHISQQNNTSPSRTTQVQAEQHKSQQNNTSRSRTTQVQAEQHKSQQNNTS